LSLLVGIADYFTGRELQVVPLYLLPVGLATWIGGRRVGMFFAVLCAAVWLAFELALHAEYPHPFDPFWNAAGLLLTFTAVCWILSGLQRSLNNLERQVELRTAALREEMLMRHQAEEARLQAERLAVVGTMAAQVAHEVRNPLGSITLNLELLSREIASLAETGPYPPDEANFLVAQFKQELNRIKQVVDGYMQLARLPHIETQEFRLHDFLAPKLQLLAPELTGAGVELVQDFDPAISTVDSDPDKLWQVLVNLVRNACQALPAGGRVTLTTLLTDNELRISVRDSGKGVPPENLPKLFTPFFTTKADGTGLGLVLVHQIITEMGGRITCQSEYGQGATFTLAFPLLCVGIEPKPKSLLQ
jgi:signal transduction histidine kinase